LAAVISTLSLFISGCGQAPQDKNQSSLVDKQNSITTTDHNRRLFFKSSHEEIRFGYAVQSCFVKLGGNFLFDGYNSFCGEYNQNQNISGGSVAYVNEIKINGINVRITGQVFQVQSCDVDVSQIIDKAKQNNNNSVIPPRSIRDGKLKLENNDKLTLPSGVYYFREVKISGRAVLEFSGPSTVVVEGDISVDGQGQIKSNPVFLRIISTGKVKVEGQGSIYAGIVGNEVKVDGKGQIFGGVISREFKGEGQGAVHFDKGLGLDRIEVFPSEVTIKVGETVQLTARAKDIFGNEISCVGFEWSSSDPSVAVVDQNGLVQGVGEGRATISAIAKKEGYNLAFKGEAIVNVIISEALCPFISGYSLWARVYGGQGDDFGTFKRTSDGGYIIVGQTFSFGAGGGDLLVMKLDSNGNIKWQKTYGGPGHDWAYDVEETQDGGYIVGGGTGSFGAGGIDMWILKLDSHGNVQWQKTYGGWGVGIDGLNAEYVHDLLQTSDEGYIVVGGTTSYGAGDRDIWVLKLDSQGNVQWQRTYWRTFMGVVSSC
jgi:predicted secreted protein